MKSGIQILKIADGVYNFEVYKAEALTGNIPNASVSVREDEKKRELVLYSWNHVTPNQYKSVQVPFEDFNKLLEFLYTTYGGE